MSGRAVSRRYRARLNLAILTLTTCVSCNSSKYYPASAALCAQPLSLPGWSGNVFRQANDDYGQVDYIVTVSDDRPRRVAADDRSDAIYWVTLSGLSGGQHATPPIPPQPMLFAAQGAWIEVNGQRTAADPVVRLPDPRSSGPGEYSTSTPTDLNTTAIGSLRVFVVFNVKRPGVADVWRVHLGTIRLGGETVTLPDYVSCVSPAHTERAQPWQS